MRSSGAKPVTSLYVHVPFCAQKCSYCAFFSEPSKGELINRYVEALVRELEVVAPNVRPGTLSRPAETLNRAAGTLSRRTGEGRGEGTVFFGGGTPSLLNLKQWEKILEAMGRLNLLGAEEWTIECNPATVSLEKARLWRSYGVNRVSMGVQSLDEDLLDRLGRIHSREMVFKSYEVLRAGGFENVNLDLMFAIPGQTLELWRETLREACAMGSEHLSCYEVIYEEDTPLFNQLQAGEVTIDEELACAMYEELLAAAEAKGFRQYEIANFARDLPSTAAGELPTFACRHNVNYWRGGEYYGLGPSAAGYVNGERTRNWANTTLYCEQLEKGCRAIEWKETLAPLQRAGETAAFGLRMNAGWPFQDFQRVTGFDLRNEWDREMDALLQKKWAAREEHRFYLTSQGLRFADAAAELFLK